MPDTTPRVVPARYPWHEPEEGTCPVCYPYGGCGSPQPKVVMNDRWQSVAQFKEGLGLTGEQSVQFDRLNRQFQGWPLAMIYPGEVLLVGDPDGGCRHELEEQLKLVTDIHLKLSEAPAPQDDILIEYHAVLNQILGNASLATGAVSDAWTGHLKGVEKTLKEIEAAYAKYAGPNGDRNKDAFFKKRAELFKRLDYELKSIGRWATQLRKEQSVKRMLNVSTKSYKKTGVIKGYASKISNVSKAAAYISKGTYVGSALTVAGTALDIRNACALGREEACRKAKIVETSKLGFNLGGTYAGAKLGAAACVAIGVPTAGVGTIACVIILGGAGAYLGGRIATDIGDVTGEMVYEHVIGE